MELTNVLEIKYDVLSDLSRIESRGTFVGYRLQQISQLRILHLIAEDVRASIRFQKKLPVQHIRIFFII